MWECIGHIVVISMVKHLQDLALHVQPPRAPVAIDANGPSNKSREEERSDDEPRWRWEGRP